MAIDASVGPFSQGGLDEALGFAVGTGPVELGEDMSQTPAPTSSGERQRAKYFGVVGHDAAYLDTEAAIVARGMIEKRCGTGLAFVGKHLSKRHARTIVNGHEGRFVADAADMMLRITGDAVYRPFDARELLAVEYKRSPGRARS